MNKLPKEKQIQILAALVEGNSIRSTCRMTGIAKGTVLKLLADVGKACEDFQRSEFMGLYVKQVQCDEIWAFCYAKQKNVPPKWRGLEGMGDVWTWTALDADSKLMITWYVGDRSGDACYRFISDLRNRIMGRVQISTDAFITYKEVINKVFDGDVNYGMLLKKYGTVKHITNARYSPAICLGTRKIKISGHPDKTKISTSYVERQNLTMRMNMRRFTRLTNAFSKKIDNMRAAVALHYMHYNYCRVHQTLNATPAMKAGLTHKVWELDDIVDILYKSQNSSKQQKRSA